MTISAKTKTPRLVTLYYIVWCILWTIGGLIAFIHAIDKPKFSVIMWLVLWAIAEYLVICIIHWYLYGIEIIKIENETFYFTRNGIYRRTSINAKLTAFKRLDIVDNFGNLHEIYDRNNNLRFNVNGREYKTLNKFTRQDVDSLILELKNKKIITEAHTSYKS